MVMEKLEKLEKGGHKPDRPEPEPEPEPEPGPEPEDEWWPSMGPEEPEPRPPPRIFRDVDEPWCPELVEIPPGSFFMGSSDDDDLAYEIEHPRHKVTISRPFALGVYPVTFDEFDVFCEAADHDKPEDGGWGRVRNPVINVSWNDAVAYCQWLSTETGADYRLPSEAEWEYACRAGTETAYWWGEQWDPQMANADRSVEKTTKVGAYPANPWGLHDTHGNVWEWVEDVWHDNYEGAPDDGTAWTEGGDATDRVLRGSSWSGDPGSTRSAVRNGYSSTFRISILGFRVSKTL